MITKRVSTWACAFTLASVGYGQIDWHANPGGNNIIGGEWFGADGSSTIPLQIRHDGLLPIEFHTTGNFRALINPQVTYTTLGSFSLVEADGFGLITPNTSFFSTVKGPFSRLHLAEGSGGNAQTISYRPWQRNGITFTGNKDHGYVGQKYGEEEDNTDMVIDWSDNPGAGRPDRLRFLFTSGYDPMAATGAQSYEGLEGMRLWPVDYEQVNVGVGDFFADGTEPTERLHVVNGRVRIEELPNDMEAEGLTRVVVVDDAATDERGVLKWMDITNLIPVDCEWNMTTGANNHVYTAIGAADPNCPDATDAVGIGLDPSTAGATPAKLHVSASNTFPFGTRVVVTNASGNSTGSFVDVTGSGQSVRGMQVFSHGTSTVARAGEFISYDAGTYAHGVNGEVHNCTGEAIGVEGITYTNALSNYGVKGEIVSPITTGAYYAVHGEAPVQANCWAGWFEGDMNVNGVASCNAMAWTSDANLKTNVEDITSAVEILGQLAPKNYDFLTEEHPTIGLPIGPQHGFIAQEVEEVIPDLVSTITIAAKIDSLGNVVYPEETVKALNYIGIIPYLVAGINEQQSQLAASQATNTALNEQLQEVLARVDAMEQNLAACCAIQATPADLRENTPGIPSLNDTEGDGKLRIQPNPFSESTTVYYTLERGGRAQLMANSADGKQLRVLQEANLESGDYQYNWNTADLAAGIYYVTLLVDGQPVVKKAVKVNR